MRVEIDGATQGDDENITIENINYSTGEIFLNKPIVTATPANVTFYGDRNLSFGDVANGVSGIKKITGINIIDGMLFWTDNSSEPKKINIERSKDGSDGETWYSATPGRRTITTPANYPPQRSLDNFNQHTLLIIEDKNPEDCIRYHEICN